MVDLAFPTGPFPNCSESWSIVFCPFTSVCLFVCLFVCFDPPRRPRDPSQASPRPAACVCEPGHTCHLYRFRYPQHPTLWWRCLLTRVRLSSAKTQPHHFEWQFCFSLKKHWFFEKVILRETRKRVRFLGSGRKTIILIKIIMLIWVSGYNIV